MGGRITMLDGWKNTLIPSLGFRAWGLGFRGLGFRGLGFRDLIPEPYTALPKTCSNFKSTKNSSKR